MNYHTYILKFKGSDNSYLYPISLNLDLSCTKSKEVRVIKVYSTIHSLANLPHDILLINSNGSYSTYYEGNESEGKMTKELMRCYLGGDLLNSWNNFNFDNISILPLGMSDLKIWLTDENGNPLDLTLTEIASLEIVVVIRIYN